MQSPLVVGGNYLLPHLMGGSADLKVVCVGEGREPGAKLFRVGATQGMVSGQPSDE